MHPQRRLARAVPRAPVAHTYQPLARGSRCQARDPREALERLALAIRRARQESLQASSVQLRRRGRIRFLLQPRPYPPRASLQGAPLTVRPVRRAKRLAQQKRWKEFHHPPSEFLSTKHQRASVPTRPNVRPPNTRACGNQPLPASALGREHQCAPRPRVSPPAPRPPPQCARSPRSHVRVR